MVAACATEDSGAPVANESAETTTGATTQARRPAEPRPATTTRAASTTAPRRQAPAGLTGAVTSVVDGDTIKVRARGFETTVRLIGIDTPETRHPSEPVQCFGPAASERVKRILPAGQRVRLETDPTQDRRDRYDRLLAYVHKPGRSGPRGSVNYGLVATGYAKVYIHQGNPFRYARAFQAAERRAKAAERGLWGPPCNGDTTQRDPSVAASPTPPQRRPATSEGAGGACDPDYSGACVPPYPPDVDCADIGTTIHAVGSDPHRLDGDRDGVACESFKGP